MRDVTALEEIGAGKAAGWYIAAMSMRRGQPQPRIDNELCEALYQTYMRSYEFPLSIMYVVYRIGISRPWSWPECPSDSSHDRSKGIDVEQVVSDGKVLSSRHRNRGC